MKLRALILIGLSVLVLGACRRGQVTGIERNDSGGATVSATLTESDINDAISDALAVRVNPLLRNPSVDLQNGQIIINGEHESRGARQVTVNGSLTVSVTVQDGALLAQVTAADIEGLTLTDARIAQFNERLSNNFTGRANRENRRVTFKTVTISDSALDVTFDVQP